MIDRRELEIEPQKMEKGLEGMATAQVSCHDLSQDLNRAVLLVSMPTSTLVTQDRNSEKRSPTPYSAYYRRAWEWAAGLAIVPRQANLDDRFASLVTGLVL